MGICGSKDKSNFSTPGRTLASAPPPPSTRAKLPAAAKPTPPSSQPARAGRTTGGPDSSNDPRAAAARAAEARLSQAKGKGKLAEELHMQKKKTMNATRAAEAQENLARRETDRAAEVQKYS